MYTIPPLAAGGLSEEEARRRGLRTRVEYGRTPACYAVRQVAEPHAGYEVLLEAGTDRVLGAHWIGAHADEAIDVSALAIRAGLGAQALGGVPWADPTQPSDLGSML